MKSVHCFTTVWLHMRICSHTDAGLCLPSPKPVPSEAQSSARLLIPPTLFSPISATPNFSLLQLSWLLYVSALPFVCISKFLNNSPSLSLSLQVLVAFISFSETMLLVYLSYKVSCALVDLSWQSEAFRDVCVYVWCVCVWACIWCLREVFDYFTLLLNWSFPFSSCIWSAPQAPACYWHIWKTLGPAPVLLSSGGWSINGSPCLWCTWHYKPIKDSLCRLFWRLEALAFRVDWFLWTYPVPVHLH